MLNKIIPDFHFDLQGAGEAFEDMKQMGLSGETPLGEAKTKAPNSDYYKDEPLAAARQAEVARDYLKRAARIDELNGPKKDVITDRGQRATGGELGTKCFLF